MVHIFYSQMGNWEIQIMGRLSDRSKVTQGSSGSHIVTSTHVTSFCYVKLTHQSHFGPTYHTHNKTKQKRCDIAGLLNSLTSKQPWSSTCWCLLWQLCLQSLLFTTTSIAQLTSKGQAFSLNSFWFLSCLIQFLLRLKHRKELFGSSMS